jgi:hypothetical protein
MDHAAAGEAEKPAATWPITVFHFTHCHLLPDHCPLSITSFASYTDRRNTVVESLSLKGWIGLKDGDIMTVCSTLQHLK